jgi:uncharacterized membrane protein YesL
MVNKLIQKRHFLLCTIPPLLTIPATVALALYAMKIGPPSLLLFGAVVLLVFCVVQAVVRAARQKDESKGKLQNS